MSALLFLLTGCSLRLGVPYAPAEHSPPAAIATTFDARDPAALFDDAITRREAGDAEGAIQRLVHLRLAGDTSTAVLNHLGVTYENIEDHETALSVYDLLLSEDREPGTQRDAGFRRAQVLEALGQHDDALRQLKAIKPPPGGFDAKDQHTYDIQLGIAMLRAGPAGRGERKVRGGLDALAGTDATYIQAKGRYGLIEHQLFEVADLPLEGRERKVQKNLEARGLALLDAESVLGEAVIPLGEPEWILAGVMLVGDGYAALGRDILSAPPPSRLTVEQQNIYESTVREKAAVIYRKAWTRYDTGLAYAGELGMENRYTRALAERRDALNLDQFID